MLGSIARVHCKFLLLMYLWVVLRSSVAGPVEALDLNTGLLEEEPRPPFPSSPMRTRIRKGTNALRAQRSISQEG